MWPLITVSFGLLDQIKHFPIVIIRLMFSVYLCPVVITLSGYNCTYVVGHEQRRNIFKNYPFWKNMLWMFMSDFPSSVINKHKRNCFKYF